MDSLAMVALAVVPAVITAAFPTAAPASLAFGIGGFAALIFLCHVHAFKEHAAGIFSQWVRPSILWSRFSDIERRRIAYALAAAVGGLLGVAPLVLGSLL